MKKLLSLLMLLCMVCTGAWADFSAGYYTIRPYADQTKYVVPSSTWATTGAEKFSYSNTATFANGGTWIIYGNTSDGFLIKPANPTYAATYPDVWDDADQNAIGVWNDANNNHKWKFTPVEGHEDVYTVVNKGKTTAYFWYNSTSDFLFYKKGSTNESNWFVVEPVTMPFEFSTSKDAPDAKWYSIEFRNQNGNTFAYVENSSSTQLGQSTNGSSLTNEQKAFCFVQHEDGFYIYNKGTGLGVKVDAVTDRAPVKVSATPTLIKYRLNGTDHFLYDGVSNNQNNTLASWSNQDAFIAISAAGKRSNYDASRAVFTRLKSGGVYEIRNLSTENSNNGRGYVIDYTGYTNGPSIGECTWSTYASGHPAERNNGTTTCSYWYIYPNEDGTSSIFSLSTLSGNTTPKFLNVGTSEGAMTNYSDAVTKCVIANSASFSGKFTISNPTSTNIYMSAACGTNSNDGSMKASQYAGDGGVPYVFLPISESSLSDAQRAIMEKGIRMIEHPINYDYTINCTGLAQDLTGGVTYNRVNYSNELPLDGAIDRDALIAMHVSGYKGTISNVDEENRIITVTYSNVAEATDILWDDNNNNTKLPAARIPAIIKSGDYILAFSDWRYNRDDIGRGDMNGHIDIEMRRSNDGGVTWSPAIIAADGDGILGSNEAGFGDAAVVADAESNNVLMLAAAGHVTYTSASRSNPIRVGKFTSPDNGVTWTKSDITETIYNLVPSATAIFTTSGKILQGTFKKTSSQYRRVYAVLVTTAGDYVIYSDDFGGNWAVLGGAAAQNASGNEAHVTELPNGDILLDSRCGSGGRMVNIFAYSNQETAEGAWGTFGSKMGMGAADCNGDIDVITGYANGSGAETKVLLQSAPRSGRNNVQYYYKAMPELNSEGHYNLSDFTSGWTAGYEVYHGASAYSSIFNDGNGVEYMIYERNTTNNTYNYDIVFEKHDISLITNNAYFGEAPSVEQTIVAILSDGNGNTFRHQYRGGIGTLPTVPSYCTVATNGTWAKVDDHYTYTADITMPFVVSNAENVKYYNMYFPTGTEVIGIKSPIYLYYNSSNAGKLASDNSAIANINNMDDAQVWTASEEDTYKYSWAIYGDPFTGFTFKNRASQTFINVEGLSSGLQNVKLAAEGSVFTLDYESSGDYGGRWTMQSGTGYIVQWSYTNTVATYNTNKNHNGGHFYLVETPDFAAMTATLAEKCDCLGTTLGTYAYTGSAEDLITAQSIVAGETTPANAKQLKTYIDAMTNGRGGLNMPQPGTFLRLKSHKFGTYLNSATVDWNGNRNLLTLANGKTGDNEKTTIMYLTDDNKLVTYATAMGLCNSIQIKTADSDPYEGNTVLTFTTDSKNNAGCYNIKGTYGTTNNYLYGYSDKLARYGSVTDECVWELEEVETLPITLPSSGYTTLYSPVSLTLPEGLEAFIAILNEENATVFYSGRSEVPANTGVLLRRADGSTGQTSNHALGTDGTAEQETSSLIGKAYTQAYSKDNNTVGDTQLNDKYVYTLQSGTFKYYTGTKLTGFKAHYELQDGRGTGNVRQYSFNFDEGMTTGVAEIEGMVNAKATVFDLSGRRLEKVAKGINIVNGKKVIR